MFEPELSAATAASAARANAARLYRRALLISVTGVPGTKTTQFSRPAPLTRGCQTTQLPAVAAAAARVLVT